MKVGEVILFNIRDEEHVTEELKKQWDSFRNAIVNGARYC